MIITKEERDKLVKGLKNASKYNKFFQGIVALISNFRSGIDVSSDDYRIQGIAKCEGGVVVNHREIVIRDSYEENVIRCNDDWDYKRREESEIVEKVVCEVATDINWSADEKTIFEQVDKKVHEETKIDIKLFHDKMIVFGRNPFACDSLKFFEIL